MYLIFKDTAGSRVLSEQVDATHAPGVGDWCRFEEKTWVVRARSWDWSRGFPRVILFMDLA